MQSLIFRIFAQSVTLPTPHVDASGDTVTTILNIIYAVVGALTLLFVVFGGFKFIISRGDPQATARAKDTILYAVIGLAVVFSAALITNFVIGKLGP